jgi:hypothetical protein
MKRYYPGQDFVGMPEVNPDLDKSVLTAEEIRGEKDRLARLSMRFDVAYGVYDRPIAQHTLTVLTLVLAAVVIRIAI